MGLYYGLHFLSCWPMIIVLWSHVDIKTLVVGAQELTMETFWYLKSLYFLSLQPSAMADSIPKYPKIFHSITGKQNVNTKTASSVVTSNLMTRFWHFNGNLQLDKMMMIRWKKNDKKTYLFKM